MKSVGERLAYTRNTILSMNQKDFSKLLCISQGALSEIENNKRGLPMEAIIELMKYSKKIKIDRAKVLLLTTNKSLLDISISLGFYDQSHFSRTFKSFE